MGAWKLFYRHPRPGRGPSSTIGAQAYCKLGMELGLLFRASRSRQAPCVSTVKGRLRLRMPRPGLALADRRRHHRPAQQPVTSLCRWIFAGRYLLRSWKYTPLHAGDADTYAWLHRARRHRERHSTPQSRPSHGPSLLVHDSFQASDILLHAQEPL